MSNEHRTNDGQEVDAAEEIQAAMDKLQRCFKRLGVLVEELLEMNREEQLRAESASVVVEDA